MVLVRFPKGWTRPVSGYYEAAEEVVFLDGTLRINDTEYRAGDWAYMPRRWIRRRSEALTDVLALARFSGPARWVEAAGDSEPVLTASIASVGGETVASPLGPAIPLRAGDTDRSWVAEGIAGPASVDAELLSLEERRWSFAPAGSPVPSLRGRIFCRTYG